MSSLWNGLQDLLGATLTFFYELDPQLRGGDHPAHRRHRSGAVSADAQADQVNEGNAGDPARNQEDSKGIQDRQARPAAGDDGPLQGTGVNPAAGCLPLLLQMPVWFALFSVLRSFGANSSNPLKYVTSGSALEEAISAGHDLVFLWMNLAVSPSESMRDTDAFHGSITTAIPYMITIALVILTAYWQQKQTMAKQPPGQPPPPGQAVMKIFPLFFGFISFNLPAGLVVYFAASQLFRIGQQSLILGMDTKRRVAAPEKPKGSSSPAPRPADPGTSGVAATPSANRRPQGSKKRGKKRRRN